MPQKVARTWIAYASTVVLLVAGMWLVLSLGSKLKAPPDLGGRWEWRPVGAGGVATPAQPVEIEQSGKYFKLTVAGRKIPLFLEEQIALPSGEGMPVGQRLRMSGATSAIMDVSDDGLAVTLSGESSGSYALGRAGVARPAGENANPVLSGSSAPATRGVARPSAPATAQPPPTSAHNLVLTLLLQIVLILGVSRVMGLVFVKFGQPQVMGEMVAGIMLGPSLLGLLAPDVARSLFPPESVQYLSILSQLGVVFFLFLIGLELDPKLLRNRGHAAVVISHASIVAPFLLGGALTLFLYDELFNAAPRMKFTSVALFMGAAMSITAFPVLARILTERNLHKTKIGAVTITCAAVDDVTAWCMLAFVIGIARADGIAPGLLTAGLSIVYVLLMFFGVRPFLQRLERVHDRQGRLSQGVVAIIFLLVLASAYTTEAIGIHALFGAFLMGAMMPKGTLFVRAIADKLEDYTIIFLLPIFFAFTGLKTEIGLLNTPALWGYTAVIILVACVGKFGGSALASRACGLSWRESAAVGTLMNTRGLMELVILTIGLQEGVITPAVFAMMVLMALVTTAMTTPVLAWVYPQRLLDAEMERTTGRTRSAKSLRVLVPVALPESGAMLAKLAGVLIGKAEDGGRLFALHLGRAIEHQAYRAAVDDAPTGHDPALRPLLDAAARDNIPVEPISFVSGDVASDIARITANRSADLVIMGFHKPVFGKTILGGTVHHVLSQCETDVGVFVDRGTENFRTIMVPYLGGTHDRLAMDLAGRIGRNVGAKITVLHVVPPLRGGGRAVLGAKEALAKTFADATQPEPVEFRVVEDDSPVTVVLQEAAGFDLIILGVSEEWGLESRLFGWRPERIARECPVSMLIVRKFTTTNPAEAPLPSAGNPTPQAV